MRCFSIKTSFHSHRLAWFLTPVLLATFVLTGGVMLISHAAHAAPASTTDAMASRYSLHAITTAGPSSGVYFTGAMALTVSDSSITGKVCGLTYARSRCTMVTGTASGNNATLIIRHVGSMPDVNLAGTFHTASGAKGSFTGFSGTFQFGQGAKISSGRWEAIKGSFPTASGTWQVYLLVKVGPNAGRIFHGVMSLSENSDGKLSGQYCPVHGACVMAKGTDQFGYLYIQLGTLFVLKGTFTDAHRADGQFYIPDSHTGFLNYWLAH